MAEQSLQFHHICLHYPEHMACFISPDGTELLLASRLRDEVVLTCQIKDHTLCWSPNWGIQALTIQNGTDYTVIPEAN